MTHEMNALPRGFCDECCMRSSSWRRLPLHDGGTLLGGRCPHHNVIAVLRLRPDGSALPWRMERPASEEDLRVLMATIAGAVHGVVEGQEDLRKRREGGLN